jgi:hypothetical protein
MPSDKPSRKDDLEKARVIVGESACSSARPASTAKPSRRLSPTALRWGGKRPWRRPSRPPAVKARAAVDPHQMQGSGYTLYYRYDQSETCSDCALPELRQADAPRQRHSTPRCAPGIVDLRMPGLRRSDNGSEGHTAVRGRRETARSRRVTFSAGSSASPARPPRFSCDRRRRPVPDPPELSARRHA